MLCVGGNENVTAYVDPCAGAFLERDDRKAVEKVIEYLFTLFTGLRRDSVANLGRGIKDVVIADLCEPSYPANRGSDGERLEIAVVHLGCKPGGAQWIEAGELVEIDG